MSITYPSSGHTWVSDALGQETAESISGRTYAEMNKIQCLPTKLRGAEEALKKIPHKLTMNLEFKMLGGGRTETDLQTLWLFEI